MSSSDTAIELEKLRAEVAALRAAKEGTEAEAGTHGAAAAESASPTGDTAPAEDGPEHSLRSQIAELTDLLEDEIRDLPTITCLAVFTAGILLGRFLR